MVESIIKFIEAGLKDNVSLSELKSELSEKGILESDIESAISKMSKNSGYRSAAESFKIKLYRKIFLDRIGYGFSATPFVNILFSMTGASLFFIGVINALKSAISTLLSGFMSDYSKKVNVSRNFIRFTGLIYGFSFIFLALSVSMRSDILFALALLFGSIGTVSYGDSFKNMMLKKVGRTNFMFLISRVTFVGLGITALSLLLSGFVMDFVPLEGRIFIINLPLGYGFPMKIFGYLIAFMITAFTSIFSAHILANMKLEAKSSNFRIWDYLSVHTKEIFAKSIRFIKNKYLFIITFTTLVIAIFQSVVNSFVGIYIYFTYEKLGLGGFMNVALIFAIALVVSYAGPIISSRLNKIFGLAPLFVFGSIIMALLPLTIVFNPSSYYPAILFATVLSFLGVSIIGSVQGLLAARLLNERDRNIYYASSGFVTVVPFLIVVSLLSSFAFKNGIVLLFKYVGIGVLVILIPLYLLLVFWSSNKRSDF